jgi:hypothetical protein
MERNPDEDSRDFRRAKSGAQSYVVGPARATFPVVLAVG